MKKKKIKIVFFVVLCVFATLIATACKNTSKSEEEDINYEYLYALDFCENLKAELEKIKNHDKFNGNNSYFGVLALIETNSLYNDFAPLQSTYSHYYNAINDIYNRAKNVTNTLENCEKESRQTYANQISGLEDEYSNSLNEFQTWATAVEKMKNGIDEIANFDTRGYYTSKYELNEYKSFVRKFLNEFLSGSKQNYTPAEFTTEVNGEITLLKELLNAKVKVLNEYDYYVGDKNYYVLTNYKYKSYWFYLNLAYIEVESGTGSVVIDGKDYVERTTYSSDELYGVIFETEYYEEAYKTMNEGGEARNEYLYFIGFYNRDRINERFKSIGSIMEVNEFAEQMRLDYAIFVDAFNTAYDYNDKTWLESNRAVLYNKMDEIRDVANTSIKDSAPKMQIDKWYNDYRSSMSNCVRSYEAYEFFREYCKKVYAKLPQ